MSSSVRSAVDWGKLAPLRITARHVADGAFFAGGHRSKRRGSGVEFGGHREYVPGDDLRWLDRHALMRHGRLLVREFETETDRALWLVVDSTASMAFHSQAELPAKFAYAALLGAALGRIAISGGDPIALEWLGSHGNHPLALGGGNEAFERLIGFLEEATLSGEIEREALHNALSPVGRRARRGSSIVVLSDFIDLPPGTADLLGSLSTRRRTVCAVQVLDPVEAHFPFDGAVRLRASEGTYVVETDASAARSRYLAALEDLRREYDQALIPRGGRFLRLTTSDDPVVAVRRILATLSGDQLVEVTP